MTVNQNESAAKEKACEDNPQCEADFLTQQKRSSKYNSFSKAAMYIGGLLTTGILGAAITSMLPHAAATVAAAAAPIVAGAAPVVAAAAPAAAATGLAALGAFFATPAVIALLAVGIALVGFAIATDYKSSTIYQKVNYKTSMFNAKKTADFLVDDLKQNNMCLTNEQDSSCASKTNWAAQIEAQRLQATAATR